MIKKYHRETDKPIIIDLNDYVSHSNLKLSG